MENITKKESALWWRLRFLEITKISLNLLKKTNDPTFKQHAIYFGSESKKKEAEYQGLLRSAY